MVGWETSVISPRARLNQAMRQARAMFDEAADEPFPLPARLIVENRTDFVASVTCSDGRIRISTGVVLRLDELWSLLWESGVLTGARGGGGPAEHTDLSLAWLLLHELMHVRLQHHRLLRDARLVEVGAPDEAEAEPAGNLRAFFAPEDHVRLRRCLELQADDDASRIFLGEYTEAGTDAFRARAVAVFAVMALIERENARQAAPGISHPAALTRLFMLMAAMLTIWGDADAERDIRDDGHAYLPGGAMPAERFDAYLETVLRPLLDDVMMVVSASGASSFVDDLHNEGALFHDLRTALFDQTLSPERFATHAAREWLDLAPTNQKILRYLGHF